MRSIRRSWRNFTKACSAGGSSKRPASIIGGFQSDANTANGFNGGLTYRPFPGPRSWVHYVHVDSLDHMVAEVVRLGGEVLRSKTAVPKTAWYAVVADPEGNIFAVWQPDKAAMPAPEPD